MSQLYACGYHLMGAMSDALQETARALRSSPTLSKGENKVSNMSINDGACAKVCRQSMPNHLPLFFRLSALDGSNGHCTMDDTIALSRALKEVGVDVIDCSSGGMAGPVSTRVTNRGYAFQVPYASAVRREAAIFTMAVGLIVDPHVAEGVLQSGHADLIATGREALKDPNWPLRAQRELGGTFNDWPAQYKTRIERHNTNIEEIEAKRAATEQ